MLKRALVLGSGGLLGAFAAGVAAELCRLLPKGYFHSIYMSSVGVYAGTFFAAGQPDEIEYTWRERVDGNKLVNFLNPLLGREILDLEYLEDIFSSGPSKLDVEAALGSGISLEYAVTEYPSGRLKYVSPTISDTLRKMTASSAVPVVHGPVRLNGCLYVDGGLNDPLPILKAIEDGHDEIVVVTSKPVSYLVNEGLGRYVRLSRFILPPNIANLLHGLEAKIVESEKLAITSGGKIIRPEVKPSLRHFLDTDKGRINSFFGLGIEAAREFVEEL